MFLILAKNFSEAAFNLQKLLSKLDEAVVILDAAADAPHCVFIEDAERFSGLMSPSYPKVTAWSRAFAYLQTQNIHEPVWFVEDDVAGDLNSFQYFFDNTNEFGADLSTQRIHSQHEEPDWPWWRLGGPYHSFNPLCRISPKLINILFDYSAKHEKLLFQEILFPSAARQNNLKLLDWQRASKFSSYLKEFRWRPPVVKVARGISHPVKDRSVHAAICSL